VTREPENRGSVVPLMDLTEDFTEENTTPILNNSIESDSNIEIINQEPLIPVDNIVQNDDEPR